jgi:hypothetical protein
MPLKVVSTEQLLKVPFFCEKRNKNTILEGSWMLKFVLCVIETAHEPSRADRLSPVQ